MKTLKFMLAAATAIGLASAYAEPEEGASTTFESLALDTPVVTGLNDEGGSTGLSYFYYAGSTAEDNESTIVSGAPDIARPTGATGERSKILQVSTGTDPLLRAFTSFTQGSSPQSSTFTQDVYVDTLVQFTVTPYTDKVTPGDEDKLMIYLKECTNDVGVVTGTNLVVVGNYYDSSASPAYAVQEYVAGVSVEPGCWYRLTVEAIPTLTAGGPFAATQKQPGFRVYINGQVCSFDKTCVASASASFFIGEYSSAITSSQVVLSLKADGITPASLKAVGFAGEGKVDDLMITTVDPFFTAVDFTFAGVSGVTATQTPGTDTWTITAPAGTVIKSFLVGDNPVAAAVGASSYTWTATSADAGKTVIVAAGKQLTAAAHPWYESPKGFVLAENLPGQTGNIVSGFHGQGQEEYLGLTYSTNPLQFDLYQVDGTNALNAVYQVPVANVDNPGFRGVAISKPLGIAMTLAYATTTTMYAYPLAGGEPAAVTKPETHAFDAAAFSPDGKYLFSNAIAGEGSDSPAVLKWSVSANNVTNVSLTKLGRIDATGRNRNLAYARINGRDLVFVMAETAKVDVLDLTDDNSENWTCTTLLSGVPSKISYGSLCVSGVEATGATPMLTVATSSNNGATKSDVLNVYTLTVPSSGAVTATLAASFDEDALTAAHFGDISDGNRYGNTVYVTDDNATIYFARPDNKLYAGIYVPKYDITFTAGEDSTTVSVYKGDMPEAPTPATVAGKTFAGWDPTLVAAAADATYTATYNWITYNITYKNADDSTFTEWADGYTAPTTFTAETTVDLPVAANVDVSGTFNSWTNAAGTAVANTSGLYENLVVFANVSESTGWVDDVTEIPAGTTVATQYPALTDSVLAAADAKEVTEWAATNNVAFADVAAATTGTTYSDAFLLNCAPNAAAVAAEKDDFVLTITFDASGNPVVNLPEGKKYNGTIQLKGSTDLSTWTNLSEPSKSYNFYKYELSMPSAL